MMPIFEREERYIVIKLSHLTGEQIDKLRGLTTGSPRVECVVVEADWPEYEPVWRMIEQRVNASPKVASDTAPGVQLIADLLEVIDRSHGHRHVEAAERARAYLASEVDLPSVSEHDAYRLRKIAEADCACRIPAPFDEVADHLAALAFNEGVKRRAALAASPTASDTDTAIPGGPLDMLLWCPKCHTQHVDDGDDRTPGWTNPPHRSHLCHECGCIWRPADVPTNGVRKIATIGKADNYATSPKPDTDTPVDPGVEGVRLGREAIANLIAGVCLDYENGVPGVDAGDCYRIADEILAAKPIAGMDAGNP